MKAGTSTLSRGAAAVLACALVAALYGLAARSGPIELMASAPADTYYNLLVRGFGSGHLSLGKEAPPGLEKLPDPYDPAANAPYRNVPDGVQDLSYWRGRLYLYFGPTPALILFWPFRVLTGRYLLHREAAAIFCVGGFLAGAWVLWDVFRRHFAPSGAGVLAAAVLALGLGAAWPELLARAEVYEVAIACGIMFALLGLAAIWKALRTPASRGGWLALAGAAFGLAVGARPSLLPAGAAALLIAAWPADSGRKRLRALACAFAPLAAAGGVLLLYNWLRFGSPGEFGQRYQLASVLPSNGRFFGLGYLGFNLRAYFWEPLAVTAHFPFVGLGGGPTPPPGHAPTEDTVSLLWGMPFACLAAAAPLAWRGRPEAGALRRFAAVLAAAFAASALLLGCYFASCSRYEAEFLPPLLLLAGLGLFGLESALAGRPGLRWSARAVWGLLLAVTAGANLLAAAAHHARASSDYGLALAEQGRLADALPVLEGAAALDPDLPAAHNNLGDALLRSGRLPEAIGQFAAALRLAPNDPAPRQNLAEALIESGRFPEAASQLRQVLQLDPGRAGAHAALGYALAAEGRLAEAVPEYREALRLDPSDPRVHNGFGVVLARSHRLPEAGREFEAAVRLDPGYAEARSNLVRVRALLASGGDS